MSDRWLIDVDRVVVHGAPPGPIDERDLRALVGSAIRDRLRAAGSPPMRRTTTIVRIDAGRMTGGTQSIAENVASAVVGSVAGDRGRDRG